MRGFHGLTANVAYTFSKALDNVSEVFASTGGISTPIAQSIRSESRRAGNFGAVVPARSNWVLGVRAALQARSARHSRQAAGRMGLERNLSIPERCSDYSGTEHYERSLATLASTSTSLDPP